ncbi:MAG: MFS transporter [Gemmatimonadota bacterium]
MTAVRGPAARVPDSAALRTASRAVTASFIGAGFSFASWAARIPQIRAVLHVSPGALGLILLAGAAGSGIATPLSGVIITWLGERRTAAVMPVAGSAGLATIAVGYTHGVAPVAVGLFAFGFGGASWDVAINVQGAAVEQALARSVMPRFHAGWSIGTVAGAALSAAMVALGVPVTVHLLAVAALLAATMPVLPRGFIGAPHSPGHPATAGQVPPRRSPFAAWLEPRTVLIGLFVLCMTVTEGAGNDWLSLAVIDGYRTAAVLGTLTFAVFLTGMTAGRWFGPRLIDAYGRVRVLQVSTLTALGGLLLIDFGPVLAAALAGAAAMGLGTSLGFPVGLSAAADDPRYAAGRVSTAASLGYVAFLAGPPMIGFLSDHVGVKHGLSAAAVLLAAAFFLCRATAPLRPARPGGGRKG